MRSLMVAAALAALCSSAAAADAFDGRIRIGGTGVMCVREPCPRIGAMAVAGAKDGERLTRPLYAGGTPPELVGREPDTAAVRAAWLADACLVVEGRFTRPARLDVRRVVGPCGPED